jgi:hypothetical protein
MTGVRKHFDESGQVLLLTAVCMIAVLTFLGFAIDVGHFRYVQRTLQEAADAAALAGAAEVRSCSGTADCPAMQAAATDAMTENGFSGTTVLTNCTGSAGSGVTLMINNPVCEIPNDPNSGKLNYVEAVASEQVPTYFARLVGIASETVAARAEAAHGVGGPCIYALGGPPGGPYNDTAAIGALAAVLVHSNCKIIDESDNQDALDCAVGLGITTTGIDVTGGAKGGLLGLPLCSSTPAPRTDVPAPNPRDPLAYLSAPGTANNSCGSGSGNTYNGSASQVNILLGGTYTFNPGVYCGGISITAALGSNITFNPGTYVLTQTSSGGLLGLGANGGLNITVSALSTITGQGVTFYSEGGPSTITVPETLDLSNFNLSAPTSGDYSGILFYQPSSNTSADTFLVSLAQGGVFNGAIYSPDATLNYGVTALSSSYNILVARDIVFLATVASTFGNDYSGLQTGSPLNGDNDTLVQ